MMIAATAFALQAISGLSTELPHDERLRFVFVSHERGNPKISGVSTTPTRWSRQSFYETVEKCGGRNLTIERFNGNRVVLTGDSSASNLDIARCVQASTSVRFWVGVRESGLGAVSFDQTPFMELWNI